MINDDYKAILAAIFAAMIFSLVMLFITGCETVRFGLETDYGTFSYELPKPTSTK